MLRGGQPPEGLGTGHSQRVPGQRGAVQLTSRFLSVRSLREPSESATCLPEFRLLWAPLREGQASVWKPLGQHGGWQGLRLPSGAVQALGPGSHLPKRSSHVSKDKKGLHALD